MSKSFRSLKHKAPKAVNQVKDKGPQGISNHAFAEESYVSRLRKPEKDDPGLNYKTRHKAGIVRVTETVTVDSGRRSGKDIIPTTKRRVAYRHR